jgi:hypothetical protein
MRDEANDEAIDEADDEFRSRKSMDSRADAGHPAPANWGEQGGSVPPDPSLPTTG